MKFSKIVCPVSIEKIDSNISRTTIFLNVVLMALFIMNKNPLFIAIVAFDYFIRAVLDVKYSPLRWLAIQLIKPFNFKQKPIDLAQKVFASRLGMLCSVSALLLTILNFNTAALVVASILLALSVLDSVFNFCVGCIIYNYLVYPFYKNR